MTLLLAVILFLVGIAVAAVLIFGVLVLVMSIKAFARDERADPDGVGVGRRQVFG